MNIEMFTLCDFAQQYDGKLTIVGAYNGLTVQRFPHVIPTMTLVGSIAFTKQELGDFEFQIQFVNSKTGEEVIKPFKSKVQAPSVTGEIAYLNLIVNIGNLVIREAGVYHVSLVVNGETKTTCLYIRNTDAA